jgi:predicted aldo/keto reductase-like oxidoreductase
MYDDQQRARFSYNNFVREERRADQCVECGECEEQCPQGIAIAEWLEKVHGLLSAQG